MALVGIFPFVLVVIYFGFKVMSRQMILITIMVVAFSIIYLLMCLANVIEIEQGGFTEVYLSIIKLNIGTLVLGISLGVLEKTSTTEEYASRKTSLLKFIGKWGLLYYVFSLLVKSIFIALGAKGVAFIFLQIWGLNTFFIVIIIYKIYKSFVNTEKNIKSINKAQDWSLREFAVMGIIVLGLSFVNKKLEIFFSKNAVRVESSAFTPKKEDLVQPPTVSRNAIYKLENEQHDDNERIKSSSSEKDSENINMLKIDPDSVEYIENILYKGKANSWMLQKNPRSTQSSKFIDSEQKTKIIISTIDWQPHSPWVGIVLLRISDQNKWELVASSSKLFEIPNDYVVDMDSIEMKNENSLEYITVNFKNKVQEKDKKYQTRFLYFIEISSASENSMKNIVSEVLRASDYDTNAFLRFDSNTKPLLVRYSEQANGYSYRVFPLYGGGEVCSIYIDRTTKKLISSCQAKEINLESLYKKNTESLENNIYILQALKDSFNAK